MFLGGFLICLFVSIICFLFSYIIWKKKELSYISGYDEQKFTGDKDKLAKAVGIYSLAMGIVTLILPFVMEFTGSIGGILFTAVIISGTIGLIVYINKLQK